VSPPRYLAAESPVARQDVALPSVCARACLIWQASLTALPIALDAYLTADIQSAETYLKTLKRMIDSQQSAAIHL
jgi:hypothetical protein